MAGTLDSLFASSKPVQRGTSTFLAGESYLDVNISAVNMSKAVLIQTSTTQSPGANYICNGIILNSTTLRFMRYREGGASVLTAVTWQVLESN
jgi:hypothetical protein